MIVPLRWFTTFEGTIGIVGLTGEEPEPHYKVYIGIVKDPINERFDAEHIAARGMPILDPVMAAHLVEGQWPFEGRIYMM